MRMVIGQLLAVVRRYPALVDGAFVIIAWVGIKLLIEYLHLAGHHPLPGQQVDVVRPDRRDLPGSSYLYARRQGPVPDDATTTDAATELFAEEQVTDCASAVQNASVELEVQRLDLAIAEREALRACHLSRSSSSGSFQSPCAT